MDIMDQKGLRRANQGIQEKRRAMGNKHILIVEDDKDIIELLRYNLGKENYVVVAASDGEQALQLIKTQAFDLVLLDLMLPGIDGLGVCRAMKSDSRLAAIPIIMVTARGEEADIVTGLELGADDYIVKPFSPRVIIARIRSVFRRQNILPAEQNDILTHGDLMIHRGKHEVSIKGKAVELTYTEFELLHYLASRPGWVFTRFQIVDALKGNDYPVTDRSVDVQIVGLRKKLGLYGKWIETIRGVGYRFSDKDIEVGE